MVKIGARIRTIRMQQGRTLTDLAASCELSKSMISKIETGKVVPALATLSKIANALGVRLSVLMEDGVNGDFTVTPNMIDCPEHFVATDRGYNIFALAPQFPNKKMMPVLVYGKRGEVKEHSVSHAGEELIIVLEGEVAAHLGEEQFTLSKGESIYFQSATNHGFVPISDYAVYLNVLVE